MVILDGPAIGARVRAEREARGWSMRMLGHKSGVSYAYISQLERGEYPKPGIEQMIKLAHGMGLSLQELMGTPSAEGQDADVEAVLTYLRLMETPDAAALVRDLALLPAEVRGDLVALIRSMAATFRGEGVGAGAGTK